MTRDDLKTLIIELYKNYDRNVDITPGSLFDTRFLTPLLDALAVDTESDTQALIVQRIKEVYPQLAIDEPGSIAGDVIRKALGIILAPLQQLVNRFAAERKGLAAPASISRDTLAELASNFFVPIVEGTFATVTVRFEFSTPTTVNLSGANVARSITGREFVPVSGFYSTLYDAKNDVYYFEVLYTAVEPGSAYNIKANEITFVDFSAPNFIRAYNPQDASPGLDADTKEEILGKILDRVSNRSVASSSGLKAFIAQRFPNVDADVIGVDDDLMLRDKASLKIKLRESVPSRSIAIFPVRPAWRLGPVLNKCVVFELQKTDYTGKVVAGNILSLGGKDYVIKQVDDAFTRYFIILDAAQQISEGFGGFVREGLFLDCWKFRIDYISLGTTPITGDYFFYHVDPGTYGPFRIKRFADNIVTLDYEPVIYYSGSAFESSGKLQVKAVLRWQNEDLVCIFRQKNADKPQWFQINISDVVIKLKQSAEGDTFSEISIPDFSKTDGFDYNQDTRGSISGLISQAEYEFAIARVPGPVFRTAVREFNQQFVHYVVIRVSRGTFDDLPDFGTEVIYADYREAISEINDVAAELRFGDKVVNVDSSEFHLGGAADIYITDITQGEIVTQRFDDICDCEPVIVAKCSWDESNSSAVIIDRPITLCPDAGLYSLSIYQEGKWLFYPVAKIEGNVVIVDGSLSGSAQNVLCVISRSINLDLTRPRIIKYFGHDASLTLGSTLVTFSKPVTADVGDYLFIKTGKNRGIYEISSVLMREDNYQINIESPAVATESNLLFEIIQPQDDFSHPILDIVKCQVNGIDIPKAFPDGIIALENFHYGIGKVRAYFRDKTVFYLPPGSILETLDGRRFIPLSSEQEEFRLANNNVFVTEKFVSGLALMEEVSSVYHTFRFTLIKDTSKIDYLLQRQWCYISPQKKALMSLPHAADAKLNVSGKTFTLTIDGKTRTRSFYGTSELTLDAVLTQLQQFFPEVKIDLMGDDQKSFVILSEKTVVIGNGSANNALGFVSNISNDFDTNNSLTGLFRIEQILHGSRVSYLYTYLVGQPLINPKPEFVYVFIGDFPAVFISPARMQYDDARDLYYADFYVASIEWFDKLINNPRANIFSDPPAHVSDLQENDALILAGWMPPEKVMDTSEKPRRQLLPRFGWDLYSDFPEIDFSNKEEVRLSLPPVIYSSGAEELLDSRSKISVPVEISYKYVSSVDEIQTYLNLEENRILTADYLVKSKIPARFLIPFIYTFSDLSNDEILARAREFFRIHRNDGRIDINDVLGYIGGRINYVNPLLLYIFTMDIFRREKLIVQPDKYVREKYEMNVLHEKSKPVRA